MKKSTITFIILIGLFSSSVGQNQYYDAMKLARLEHEKISEGKICFKLEDKVILANILRKYAPLSTEFSEIEAAFKNNPFIKLPEDQNLSNGKTFNVSSFPNSFEKGLGAFGGSIPSLDVTTLADGMAKFIVTRTKQELNVAFFYHFKEEIEKDKYRDLQSVFPQTYRALTTIDNEIYNYEAYIEVLRECFRNDLNNLMINLPSIIDNHREFFAKFPEMEAYFRSGCYVASELRDKRHPGEIINHFPVNYFDNLPKDCKGSIKTLQLISASLQKIPANDTVYWISPAEIRALISDKVAFRIYLGLIYEQAKQTPYYPVEFSKTTLTDVLNLVAKDFDSVYTEYAQYIDQFGYKINNFRSLMASYKKPSNDSLAVEYYAQYTYASLDIFKHTVQVGKLPYIKNSQLADSLRDFFDITQATCDLTLAINRRNYSAAIINSVHIYDILINKHLLTSFDNTTVAEIYNIPTDSKEKLLKYGSLMASIAQAKTSDEVKAAIESMALPAGSARIKRESKWNIAANAYCGAFVGYEKISGLTQDNNFKVNSYGVAAPIGISFSRGHSIFFAGTGKRNWEWSSSVFLSVVDLGALTAFRFTNDSTETVPKIELKDIVSPGIFCSLGIPKTPISLNVGYQVGPLLRKVTAIKNDYDKSYGRFSVSICVDLPLLNLYNKPR